MTAAVVAVLAAAGPAVAASAQVRDAADESAWADQNGIDDYAWIDRADTLSETLGETPPDYSFAFEDEQPWAWTLDDGSLVIVEQREDGPYSYYYDPGHDEPFLVRGPAMSYAFMLGRVAVMYDAEGGVLSHADGDAYVDQALDDYARGEDLQHAWQTRDQQGEQPVEMSVWLDFWPLLYDWNQQWDAGRRQHQGWRARHVMRDALDYRMRLARERQRREQLSQRFRTWREHGWQGTPPGRWHRPPTGWQPRPDRPGRPNQPGGPGRPGGPGGWHKPGDGRPVTGGTMRPPRPGVPGTVSPRPPRQDGPGNAFPRPADGTDTGVRPARPGSGDQPGRPRRPGGWTSPRPAPAQPAPVQPSPVVATPAAPSPDAGGVRPWGDRPRPPKADPGRPVRPAEMPRPAVQPVRPRFTPPAAEATPTRPSYTPPPRPAYTPSPAVSRPSYSPPAARPAPSRPAPSASRPAPAPRSAPSEPKSSPRSEPRGRKDD